MGREKFQHSFARKRLADNHLKFFNNGKRILNPINSNFQDTDKRWAYGKMTSQIVKGVSFMSELKNKSRLMRSYEELVNKTGLMISSRTPTIRRFVNQRVEFFLCMEDGLKRDVGLIPDGYKVEVDFYNRRAILLGRGAFQKWITFQKRPSAGGGYWARETFRGYQPSTDELIDGMFNVEVKENTDEPIDIPEIIVGRSLEDGRIVTMPEENFNPTIYIVGKKGQGKTLLHYRLLDNFYHKWRKKCIDLIDIAQEAPTHCLEWRQKFFLDQLSQIGETTRSLPLVYLSPSHNNLNTIPLEGEVGFKVSLPFEEIIFDYENIFSGIEKLEFGKTATYFNNLIYDEDGNKKEDIVQYTNIRDIKRFIKDAIAENVTNWDVENPKGATSKIINCLQYLFNQKILDKSIKETAKWTIEFEDGTRKEYNPWICCLIADVVASINISEFRWNPTYIPFMKYILQDIYKHQSMDKVFLKNNSEVFIFLNEISSLVYDDVHKRFTVASDFFDMIVREARPHRIGLVFGTQSPDLISPFAKKQANYVFAFRQQNAEDASDLVKDYDALQDFVGDLKKLKTYECIGFPAGSPFRLYDEDGNYEDVVDTPVPMKIFPPLSAHKPPKEI